MTTTTNTSNDDTSPVLTAAEHTTLAASHFATAQAIYKKRKPLGAVDRNEEYRREMECADMHVRLAEAITHGATLIATHRHALADPDTKIQQTWLGKEANAWNDLISGNPVADCRKATSV